MILVGKVGDITVEYRGCDYHFHHPGKHSEYDRGEFLADVLTRWLRPLSIHTPYRVKAWPMEDVIQAYELALAHHNLMS